MKRESVAASRREELLEALRSEADLSEKGLDFMDDEDLANETRVQVGLLRDAADAVEHLAAWHEATMPVIAALAIYGEGANLAALVEKARDLNEAQP